MSVEQKNYLKKLKKDKFKVLFWQILILIIFFSLWEYLVHKEILSAFIYSSPSRIIKTIIELLKNHNFFIHIFITLKEVLYSFIIGISLGFFIAILLYEFKFLAKVLDPFLTMLNSLPKVALGPLIIIVFGANCKSIIIMALLINLIVSVISIYNGFNGVNEYCLKLFKSLHATKWQILTQLVIPSSYQTIITSFKLGVAQTLIGA